LLSHHVLTTVGISAETKHSAWVWLGDDLKAWTRESARDLAERDEVARAREVSWSMKLEAGRGESWALPAPLVVGAIVGSLV